MALVIDCTSEIVFVTTECDYKSTSTSHFRKAEKRCLSCWISAGVSTPLQFVIFGIWAGRSIQHIAAGRVNLRPISEHGGRIPRLFLWHSVVVLWSFGWQCNQCCSVRHQSYSFSISLVSLSHTLNSQTWKWT